MSLRQYLTIMSAITAVAWSAVALVVTQIDPADVEIPVLAVFYLALLLSFSGTFAVIGFLVRIWLLRKSFMLSRQVLISLRQAILMALLCVVALFLQSRASLTWWNVLLMIGAVSIVEAAAISATARRQVRP